VHARVQRWGNSLALRIPSALAEESELHEGAEVDLAVRRGKLVVERSTRRIRLSDLLDGITEDNLHTDAWAGPSEGKEAW
jgi:antitoxin MazE